MEDNHITEKRVDSNIKNQSSYITVNGEKYEREHIRTHLIHIKEPFDPIIEKYVKPHFKKGDWIAISEKFLTISQGRVIHESGVKPRLLSKIIVKGVKKYPNDIGYSHPRKMQVAINQSGSLRILFAMIVGGITRIFGRHGDFYRLAGHRISEIDGFNPKAMKPFNEYAMLGPEDPEKNAEELEKKHGIPNIIIDGNNINVEILGGSSSLPVDRETARKILLDNPMGQGEELTPIIIIRKVEDKE